MSRKTPGIPGGRQGGPTSRGTCSQTKIAQSVPACKGENFVAVARILRPQGRKGEVLAEILTDFPSRFRTGVKVFVETTGKEPLPANLENAWFHKGKVVLKFPGVNSIDAAEEVRGRCVFIHREDAVVLPVGQYYVEDLKGCQVIVEREGERKSIGRVIDVEPTGGVDLLHVAEGAEEILIPLAQSICKVIDLEAKVIVVDPPEDLLSINRNKVASESPE